MGQCSGGEASKGLLLPSLECATWGSRARFCVSRHLPTGLLRTVRTSSVGDPKGVKRHAHGLVARIPGNVFKWGC